ncbi:FAD-dependent oxidoreductase [Allostreptomyces psammosilenae]|uniref:2-polyprenyl-6-methoxyphenol hydroxylase-like FAD-dependent oxidoreductase n=1 Tax=Allostreptomyces psammosilenae TaxID=1892865 RepID=A0A852ZYC7_9ACTN|nr:FAD-dependent oxidoreductase [Allostreptomyces psammosilenae]NYI03621.1 2-polyprenyl-6-methoxyphenol hydroxylase-like FAD-dependent oxidoreductase [Allostreptomyces psammosilenae]
MRVAVVGGGVAGSVCAIALRRVGAEVTVFESHPDAAGSVGSFLSLASNGLRGLDALDCLGPVTAAGFPVARQRMWSSSGRLLGDVARGRLADDPLHSVTLMRGRLVERLREEAARSGARIITGERLADAETRPDGVRLRFAGGGSADADLLVGADGIWSTTRRLLDPAAPTPRYAGLYTVSGTTEGLDLEPGVFHMVFARAGAFLAVPAPDGTVWWSAQVASREQPDLSAGGTDDATRLRGLRELFGDDVLPSRVLRLTPRLHRPTPHHTLDALPVWHADRVVLVGDAAHPVGAGQGASMAIEDAVVLAHALRSAPSVPSALADYDARRRPRVRRMLKTAGENRDTKTAGPLARRMGELFMPVFFRHFHDRATSWLYTYDATKAA